MAQTQGPPAAAPDLRFTQAEFVVSDDREPPSTGWQLQALPDVWRHRHPGLSGIIWYRMRFTLDALPTQALALFVARVAVTGEFRLNGSVLNPQVRFAAPSGLIGTQMTNFTHLLTLPTGLFRAGENVLHIRVEGDTLTGGSLSIVRLGPIDSLRGSHALRDIPQRVIPQAMFALVVATLVFVLAVWWRERRSSHRHFVVVMALWTALLGCYLFPDHLALTRSGLAGLLALLLISFLWALLGLCWRISGCTWLWFPRLLGTSSVLMLAAAFAILLTGRGVEAMPLVLLPTMVLRVLTTVMLAQWAWRARSPRAFALAGAELVWFGGHVQLLVVTMGWLRPEPFLFSASAALPLYLVLLFFFVERFILDHEQAARDRQAAIGAERLRILHDMHDGMGAHLITALRLAQRDDVDRRMLANSIDEALQDLRLIIDSLDLDDQDLLPLLGNLRYRLQPRLAALGIRLDWAAQPVAPLPGLTPQSALGVLRIVQEAVNNAVRHARPGVITVSVAAADGGVAISVADDGTGFDVDAPAVAGRGLTGMRQRAARLGAQLRVAARSGGGTVVSLWLPNTAVAVPSAGTA